MVSVITVSFNAKNTIQKTLDSVRKSKNKSIEYIVIDGQSTDGTSCIIEKNKDIIDVYISENDRGIYDAINKGIKVASGDYTLFLAADDLLIPGAVENFLQTVKSDTDIWSGSIIYHNEYGYFIEGSDRDLDKLKCECSLRHPATFIKRKAFEQYGYYDSSLKCSGDRELFLRFYLQGAKFQIENIPIEIFNDGGISTANRFNLPVSEGIIIEKKYGIYRENTNKSVIRKIKQIVYNSFLGRALLHFYYSDICYFFVNKLFRKSLKKINKTDVSKIMKWI